MKYLYWKTYCPDELHPPNSIITLLCLLIKDIIPEGIFVPYILFISPQKLLHGWSPPPPIHVCARARVWGCVVPLFELICLDLFAWQNGVIHSWSALGRMIASLISMIILAAWFLIKQQKTFLIWWRQSIILRRCNFYTIQNFVLNYKELSKRIRNRPKTSKLFIGS